jgi:hypothetical protein
MQIRKLCVLVVLMVNLLNCSLRAKDVKAIVSVTKVVVNGTVVYEYQVKNLSNSPIWRIGLGCEPGEDPVLDVEPIRVDSPGIWAGESLRLEESSPSRFSVEWKQRNVISKPQELVQPGETKVGYKVLLPKASLVYENCVFTVYFARGGGEYVDTVVVGR